MRGLEHHPFESIPPAPFVPAQAGTQSNVLKFFNLSHWVPPLARGRAAENRGLSPISYPISICAR